jgi:hypothetical protein
MTTMSMAIWGAWILLLVIRIFNMILPQLQQLQPLLSKVLRLLLVRLLAPHLAIDLLRSLSIRLQDLNQKWESPKSPKMFRKFLWQTPLSWVSYVVGGCSRAEAISQALSALWDEQLLGHRYAPHAGRHGSSNHALWHEWHDDVCDDGYEMNYDEMWNWGRDDGWA